MIVDRWTVTVACVGDSRCVLDAQGGIVSDLTVDHRLEENVEEYVSLIYIKHTLFFPFFGNCCITKLDILWFEGGNGWLRVEVK